MSRSREGERDQAARCSSTTAERRLLGTRPLPPTAGIVRSGCDGPIGQLIRRGFALNVCVTSMPSGLLRGPASEYRPNSDGSNLTVADG
jgi:hypothetical protein